MSRVAEHLRDMATDIEHEQRRMKLLFRLTAQFLNDYARRMEQSGCEEWTFPAYLTIGESREPGVSVSDIEEVLQDLMERFPDSRNSKLIVCENLARVFTRMSK